MHDKVRNINLSSFPFIPHLDIKFNKMFFDQFKVYFRSLVFKIPIDTFSDPQGAPPVPTLVPPVLDTNSSSTWFSWSFALVYILVLLLFNNLNPFMGRHCLTASLVQYLLQGVPLMFGLTGLGPCAAITQVASYLFSGFTPDTFPTNFALIYF